MTKQEAFALLETVIDGGKITEAAIAQYGRGTPALEAWLAEHPTVGLVTWRHFDALVMLIRAALPPPQEVQS